MTTEGPRIQVLARRWKYAASPWRLHEALVDEREHWIELWDAERTPELADPATNERVVLAPWVHDETTDVEVLITTDGGQGSELTVIVHADGELSIARRKEVKYRLGTLFGEALRDWVDGC